MAQWYRGHPQLLRSWLSGTVATYSCSSHGSVVLWPHTSAPVMAQWNRSHPQLLQSWFSGTVATHSCLSWLSGAMATHSCLSWLSGTMATHSCLSWRSGTVATHSCSSHGSVVPWPPTAAPIMAQWYRGHPQLLRS